MFKFNNLLVILTILFLPIVNAELQPAFLDQDVHFLGEEINFGLVGLIPDDFNHASFEIIMPNDYPYSEATLYLENLADYYVTFPFDFVHPQVKVKYIYYNSNNTVISNQEYVLQFTKFSLMENIIFCINNECEKTTFGVLDANEITLNTQKEIPDENISFDIRVIQEGYVIEDVVDQTLPYNLDTTPGAYEIEITPKLNDNRFEAITLSLYVYNTQEVSQSPGTYIAETKQNEKKEIVDFEETTTTNVEVTQPEKKSNTLLYIIIGILGVIIILSAILLNKKPKKDEGNRRKPQKEEEGKRRKSRNQRGFLFFFVFLLCLSSIHAMSLNEKIKEYLNLEITFDKLQEFYPKPVMLPMPISNTQPRNAIYYPLSATGLGDFEKITPMLENKTKNMTVSLETVYFAGNLEKMIETAKTRGETLQIESGCEQVMDWFYQNPITEDPNSLSKRTKENLLKEIKITDKKNGYTDIDKDQINNKIASLKKKSQYKKSTNVMADYCISEVLTKQKSILGEPYLAEKKILLKIGYEENYDNIIPEINKFVSTNNSEYINSGKSVNYKQLNANIKIKQINLNTNNPENKVIDLIIDKENKEKKFVIILLQKSDKKLNIAYANIFILTNDEILSYSHCELNRKVLNYFCRPGLDSRCEVIKNCYNGYHLNYEDIDLTSYVSSGTSGSPTTPQLPNDNEQPQQDVPNLNEGAGKYYYSTRNNTKDACSNANLTTNQWGCVCIIQQSGAKRVVPAKCTSNYGLVLYGTPDRGKVPTAYQFCYNEPSTKCR